ncbi:hypothetical protein BCR33DRAFT_714744 [Rhizoclosmatium globosum]|uniref:Uncharacterized protein n=1 Tax=Rhizoclosmatium globosum TaxID=329046 RepID=A0A1Y2CKU9_9FUNG|nr:hypothetical protein BCR33DRAFT_714744 [Rhizoclosmatium globosum]|eukprot:ORY47643.1 hypothetical protein BCR33DRAFT_714744 [Rhizoclosmatium globosum]
MDDLPLTATQTPTGVPRIENWAPLFGLVGIDTLLLFWALYTIFVTETHAKGHRITLATVFTIPNVLLFAIISTGTATTLARAFYELSNRTSNISRTFNVLFLGLSEMSYLFYSWLRGKEILRIQSSSFVFQSFEYLLYSTIVFCILPTITTFFAKSFYVELLFVLSIVCVGSCVLALDTYFSYCYVLHIRDMREVNAAESQVYAIIAKYGLRNAVLGYIAVVGASGYLMTEFMMDVNGESTSLNIIHTLGQFICYLMFFGIGSTFVIMKLELLRPEMGFDSAGNVHVKPDSKLALMKSTETVLHNSSTGDTKVYMFKVGVNVKKSTRDLANDFLKV